MREEKIGSFTIIMVGPHDNVESAAYREIDELVKNLKDSEALNDLPESSSASLGVISLIGVNPTSEMSAENIYRIILEDDEIVFTPLNEDYMAIHVDDYFKEAYKNKVADCIYNHYIGSTVGARGPVLIVPNDGHKDKSLSSDDVHTLLTSVFAKSFEITSVDVAKHKHKLPRFLDN
jgi:hypothetical protein